MTRVVAPLVRRPAATAVVVVALGTVTGVAFNATALQKGRHPAPLLATRAEPKAEPPRPSPKPVPPKSAPEAHDELPTKSIAKLDLVKAVQAELHARRLYAGKVDGTLGSRTAQAIRAFERQENLPETGKPSEALLRLLRAPKATAASAELVASVQKVLAALGYGPFRIDGTLSPETRQAIERFELDRGLPATGRVHERLIQELERITGSPVV